MEKHHDQFWSKEIDALHRKNKCLKINAKMHLMHSEKRVPKQYPLGTIAANHYLLDKQT